MSRRPRNNIEIFRFDPGRLHGWFPRQGSNPVFAFPLARLQPILRALLRKA